MDEEEESWLLFQAQYPPRPLPRALFDNPYAAARRAPLYWALGAALAAWLFFARHPAMETARPPAQHEREESPMPFYGNEPGLAAAPEPGIWRAENPDKTLRYLPPEDGAPPVALEREDKADSGLEYPPYFESGRSGAVWPRADMMTWGNYEHENGVAYAGVVRGPGGRSFSPGVRRG